MLAMLITWAVLLLPTIVLVLSNTTTHAGKPSRRK